jgi:hypothetical protein
LTNHVCYVVHTQDSILRWRKYYFLVGEELPYMCNYLKSTCQWHSWLVHERPHILRPNAKYCFTSFNEWNTFLVIGSALCYKIKQWVITKLKPKFSTEYIGSMLHLSNLHDLFWCHHHCNCWIQFHLSG